MPSYLRNVKLGSQRMLTTVLGLSACVGLMSATTACVIVDGGRDDRVIVVDPPIQPMEMSIETDVSLESQPGEGVGVFVEYHYGGFYRVFTTCDTLYSGVACPLDIFMSVDTSSVIRSVTAVGLEGSDFVNVDDFNGTVDLHVVTGSDYDEVEIETTPGAILRIEVLLDGVAQPRFLYWYGNGVLHHGAPTSPVDLVPTVP
jgi:hypothetical protein